jgi:hypothetical protein
MLTLLCIGKQSTGRCLPTSRQVKWPLSKTKVATMSQAASICLARIKIVCHRQVANWPPHQALCQSLPMDDRLEWYRTPFVAAEREPVLISMMCVILPPFGD